MVNSTKHPRGSLPIVLVLLLLKRSSCEAHDDAFSTTIAAVCVHSNALRSLRGGFGQGNEALDEENEEEWEYYEEDSNGNGDDNDYEEGQANDSEQSREGDEYYYEDYEEADVESSREYYGKVQDIDGEFLSDGEAGDSDKVDGFLLDNNSQINQHENRGSKVSLPKFFAALRKTNSKAKLETPLTDSKVSSLKTKRGKWWPTANQPTNRPQSHTNSVILPSSSSSNASSGASFVYSPIVYKLSSMVRDVSTASSGHLRSIQGGTKNKHVVSRGIASFTQLTSSVLRPILIWIQSIVDSLTSIVDKSISIVAALVRNSIDTLWYGPVDGVTTTGIYRAGGLDGLLAFSPLVTIASSIVAIGIMTLWIRQQHRRDHMVGDDEPRTNNVFANALRGWKWRRQLDGMANDIDADEDTDFDNDTDSNEAPSAEEESEFLHSFRAANPTAQARIAETIAGKQRSLWPFRKSQRTSRKGQRQRSIKSIQNWWRQRPSFSSSVAIIESPQQPPPSQQISRLQTQLAQSEQERAVLQLDVQRLRHRLQKAHHDARAIVEKNKWLESQQAKADTILTRAIEAERRKANGEMEKVRGTMKDVLERERMLMRGRLAETRNAGSLRRADDADRKDTARVEVEADGLSERDAVTSLPMEGTATDSDGYEDEETIWGKRQRSLRRLSSSGKDDGGAAAPSILGGRSDFALSRRSNHFTRV